MGRPKADVTRKVAALRSFVAQCRRMPGYQEMMDIFEYRSKNAVHALIERLHELGYITKRNGKIGFTAKLMGGIRLCGTVQAGFPTPAEEELLNVVSLDSFLVERPDATFMLRVTGDSMTDAGIMPGDMVLVERGAVPKNSDIVIAQVDGEWTIKYFLKDANGIRLEPANKKYPTLRPSVSLEVAGVVRTVIRKY